RPRARRQRRRARAAVRLGRARPARPPARRGGRLGHARRAGDRRGAAPAAAGGPGGQRSGGRRRRRDRAPAGAAARAHARALGLIPLVGRRRWRLAATLGVGNGIGFYGGGVASRWLEWHLRSRRGNAGATRSTGASLPSRRCNAVTASA